jgi:nucleoside-diphosphate-sugar epimerase
LATTNSRLLITGASGFIGRHVLADLSSSDWELHAVRRTSAPESPSAPSAPSAPRSVLWHACDLRDPLAAEQLIERVKPTHVLSLAWNAEHGAYWTATDNDQWADGTIALARALARHGGRRFVGAGTCAEYDWRALNGPCEEDRTPTRPHSIYGRAKLRAGQEVAAIGRETGLPTAWGRLFFLYGPGEDPKRLVPAVARAFRAGERPKVTEGTQVRDLLHVADVARAFVALLTSDLSGPVNIGSGVGVSLRHVVETLERAAGRHDAVDFGAVPMRPDDPPVIVADTTKLHSTGWRQRVSLEEGLAAAVATVGDGL